MIGKINAIEDLLADREEFTDDSRPYITLSYAQSLDGCIAAREGTALQLSGAESMRLAHEIRACHDAILVGIGTVLVDDPRLTTRSADGEDAQAVILDSSMRFPIDARMLGNKKKPWLVTAAGAGDKKRAGLESAGLRIFEVETDEDGCPNLFGALALLRREGIRHVMVEGGAQVIASFLELRLADMVVLTVAPVFLGGIKSVAKGLSPASGRDEDTWAFPHLWEMKTQKLGDDLIVWGKLAVEQA